MWVEGVGNWCGGLPWAAIGAVVCRGRPVVDCRAAGEGHEGPSEAKGRLERRDATTSALGSCPAAYRRP